MFDRVTAQHRTEAHAERAPLMALASVIALTYSLVLALVIAQVL
jgi:hypothetical protein